MAQNTASGNAWGDGTGGSSVWVRPRARTRTDYLPNEQPLRAAGYRAIPASAESATSADATVSLPERASTVITAPLTRRSPPGEWVTADSLPCVGRSDLAVRHHRHSVRFANPTF